MFDTHVHSDFSSDSKMKIEHALEKRKQLNISIITTEHVDLNYPEENEFKCDLDKYFKKYNELRDENFLLGIEFGLSKNKTYEYKILEKKYNFDYILGAIHEYDGLDLYAAKELYQNYSKQQMYENYLEYIIECIKDNPYIDSLAHIDYICRYASYKDTEIYYKGFSDYIDGVFKELILRDISLEINTRRLGMPSAINNTKLLCERYRELGGKYVTIGSDAHHEDSIGSKIYLAAEIAKRNNLKIVYYKNRKKEYDKV
ncbi:histidinol-phosphatase HisJ family protein [Clostridium grantii]|uniref:Histidinol-phosphatase n=1 Tax=Clostridium grantii DSM 8605 TaxID=1121316 RepID=A0A1M5UM02_9CLOT|nr:histidinol-phosphatase HisJ family protein [Clostridium grantii]SHH64035.1 histidinol-phosphatase (PHP family) [Clostridium grantii DSM 8605]